MKHSFPLTGLLLALFASADSLAETPLDRDKFLELMIDKEIISEQEAAEFQGSTQDRLTLSGQVFTSFTRYEKELEPMNFTDPVDRTGVDIDRAYLTADYVFDENWRMRWRADLNLKYDSLKMSNEQDLFLKNAYVSGRFTPNLALEIGIIDTPWIVYEESLWQHRYVSRVLTDTADDSSDAGIAVRGTVAQGLVEYHLAAVNGGGYENLSTNNKSLDIDSRLSLKPGDGWTIDLQIRDGYGATKTATAKGTRSSLYQVMTTYGSKGHRIGINYFEKDTENKATRVTRDFEGYGFWGWTDIMPGIRLFGRVERSKTFKASNVPPTMADSIDSEHLVLGVEHEHSEGLTIAFAFDRMDTDNPSLLPGYTQEDERYGFYLEAAF